VAVHPQMIGWTKSLSKGASATSTSSTALLLSQLSWLCC